VIIVFKGMGIESDQEVVQMIGTDDKFLAALAPCLEECHRAGTFTQTQVNAPKDGCVSDIGTTSELI